MSSNLVSYIDPDSDPRWDAFVEAHPLGQIYHLSGWKRALESSFAHIRGFFPVIEDCATGRIRAGLPLYCVNSLLTGKRLVSIPFATLCDPLVSTSEDLQSLLDAASVLARDLRAGWIHIKTFASAHLPSDHDFVAGPSYRHHYLLLDEPPTKLLRRFHASSVRYTLRRCEKLGLTVENGDSRQDLMAFYGAYVATRRRLGLPPQPLRFFEQLWREFEPAGRLRILGARHQGRALGFILLLQFKGRVSWECIGEDPGFRTLNPTYFLVWQAIQQSYDEGGKIFDFGRTSPQNHGLMDFKRRWGTLMCELPEFLLLLKGSAPKERSEASTAYRLVRAVTPRLPKKAVVLLGELCYRHMG